MVPRPSAPSTSAAHRRTEFPWLVLAAVFAAWWFGSGGLLRSSHWAHYIYLADAFLHGQLHLFACRTTPATWRRSATGSTWCSGRSRRCCSCRSSRSSGAARPTSSCSRSRRSSVRGRSTGWSACFCPNSTARATPVPRSRSRSAPRCTTACPWATSGCTRRSPRPCCRSPLLRRRERPRVDDRRAAFGSPYSRSTTTLALPFAAWLLWTKRERDGEAASPPRAFLPTAIAVLACRRGRRAACRVQQGAVRSYGDAGYHDILMGGEFRRS